MKRTLLICLTLLLAMQVMAQQEQLEPNEQPGRPTAGTKAELARNAKLHANLRKEKKEHFGNKPPAPAEQGLTLGTNLFSLLEEDGGPSLYAEYRFTKHWEVTLQGTWVTYSTVDAFNHSGFRLQPDIKFYILPKHHKILPFIGLGGLFTQVRYEAYVTHLDDYYAGGPNFSGNKTTIENKQMLGYAFLFGFKKYLDGEKHRLSMELYFGVGSKWKSFPGRSQARKTFIENKINGVNGLREFSLFDSYSNLQAKQYGYVPICLKFGYRF